MSLATISIAVHNKAELTKLCIDSILAHTPHHEGAIEIIVGDNASTDNTQETLAKYGDDVNLRVFRYGVNTGFGFPHNEALLNAEGEYFIVLNNDVVINDDGWLDKILIPLDDDDSVAIVGLKNTPCSLRPDGTGFLGKEVDYVEGSCFAGRTALFREFGLFCPQYEPFWFEDSDASMRYRQMGYRIEHVDISFEHRHSSTLNTMSPEYRQNVFIRNANVFMGRWKGYLRNKVFSNKILVKANSLGAGDVLAMTPVIEELRSTHPKAEFTVETTYPDVFQNNPNVNVVTKKVSRVDVAYDRTIDLSSINYGSYIPIHKSAEQIAKIVVSDPRPRLHMKREELERGYRKVEEAKNKAETVAAVSLLMSRVSWQGRTWTVDHAASLVQMLEEAGIATVEIGKNIPSVEVATVNLIDQTTLRELFAVIANCDIFIGVDSLAMHVAAAFSKPSYVLFGATEPVSRVVDFSTTFAIRNEGLACLGCYQKKGVPGFNTCDLGLEVCMRNLDPELVYLYITGEIDVKEANLTYLQDYIWKGGRI